MEHNDKSSRVNLIYIARISESIVINKMSFVKLWILQTEKTNSCLIKLHPN